MKVIGKKSTKAIASTAKKAAIGVECSTHPNKRFEFLALFEGGEATIGAKRKCADRVAAQTVKASDPALTGEWKLINGVTWDCPHCGNDIIHVCYCGAIYCDIFSRDSQCPICSRGVLARDKFSVSKLTANEKTDRQKRLGNSDGSLLLSGSRNPIVK